MKKVIAILIVLLPMVAWGSTYYIDPSQTDPSEDGTEAHPFDSWADVTWSAGNSYLQKAGTTWRYTSGVNGSIVPNQDGGAESYITLGAYGSGDAPRIQRSVLVDDASDWTDAGGNIWVCNDAAITYDVGNILAPDLTCLVKIFTSTGLDTQGEYYYDAANTAVRVYSESNPHTYYGDVELAIRGACLYLSERSYFIIENLDFRLSGGSCLHMTGNASGSCTNIIVRDCDFSYIGGTEAAASPGVRLGNGVNVYNDADQISVLRCSFSQIFDAAISNQNTTTAAHTQSNITFANNYIVNCHYGYESFNGYAGSSSSNISVVHNTIVNSGGGWSDLQRGDSLDNAKALRVSTQASVSNYVIENNIISGESAATPDRLVYVRAPSSGTYTMDYNQYYSSVAGDRFWYYAGSNLYYDIDEWKANTGYDANSAWGDPTLSGYILQSGSPCINAGTNVNVGRDIDNKLRTQGVRCDIGAYEYPGGQAECSGTAGMH